MMNILQAAFFYTYREHKSFFVLQILFCEKICLYKRDLLLKEKAASLQRTSEEPQAKQSESREDEEQLFREQLSQLFAWKKAFSRTIGSALKCRKFFCNVEYGNEDPAVTGWLTGLFYTLRPFCIKKLKKWCGIQEDSIGMTLRSSFQDSILFIDCKAYFSIELWQMFKCLCRICINKF